MVKIMENPIKMDDLAGTPPSFGNILLNMAIFLCLYVKYGNPYPPVNDHIAG